MSEQKVRNRPEISIIVPVYKVEKYLNECIDSILAQTFTDFELILVAVGFVRELFGNGTLLGLRVIPDSLYVENGGFYVNNGMMTMPAMALILVGCLIWALRACQKEQ